MPELSEQLPLLITESFEEEFHSQFIHRLAVRLTLIGENMGYLT